MDTSYLIEVASLLLRWLHVIAAIAWIGSSFYFVMLDNSLTKPEHEELKQKGVDGEMWAVHGGGFYHSNKYMVAPRWLPIPKNLHWSFWEAYSTWLTGFALFTVVYLFNAGTYLIDKSVHDWSPAAAISASLGFLLAFWLIYDGICRTLGQRRNGDLIVGIGVTVFVIFASWLACNLFSGRAAFLLVGAMLATSMSANVFVWIIPGQRKVIASLRAGEKPDPIHGWRGKQRSVHNTYFTLPVIITMLSNHYGWLYQGPNNWIVLCLLMLGGALIRHSFVARHKAHVLGKRTPWEHAVAGTLIILGVMVWLAPVKAPADAQSDSQPATFAAVQGIINERCVACHNAQLQSKNIALHTPELIAQHAQSVTQQTAILKLMPMNNATGITEAERRLIRRWFETGAPTR